MKYFNLLNINALSQKYGAIKFKFRQLDELIRHKYKLF